MPGKEQDFEAAKQTVLSLKAKSSLVESTKEENKINELEANFQFISSEISKRVLIVKEDIIKWEFYVEKLNEMDRWVEEKKTIMTLTKPKDKDGVDKQKYLLEVSIFTVIFLDLDKNFQHNHFVRDILANPVRC